MSSRGLRQGRPCPEVLWMSNLTSGSPTAQQKQWRATSLPRTFELDSHRGPITHPHTAKHRALTPVSASLGSSRPKSIPPSGQDGGWASPAVRGGHSEGGWVQLFISELPWHIVHIAVQPGCYCKRSHLGIRATQWRHLTERG